METIDEGIDQFRIFSCLFLKLEAMEKKLDDITQTLYEHGQILNNLDNSRENSVQRSPTNPVRKRQYSKEFLISLSGRPECNTSPNIPTSSRVHVEKTSGGGNSGGSSSGGGGDPMMYRSEIDEYQYAPITKRSSQNDIMEPNETHSSFFYHKDVKRKKTEHARKPSGLSKTDKSTEEKRTEDLLKKVRSILTKLMPHNLNTLVDQIRVLPIDSVDRITEVVDLILTKAIDKPYFSETYAKMCNILSNLDKNKTFTRALINSCQMKFESREKIELEFKEQVARELKECTDREMFQELKARHKEEKRKISIKSAGNCRFIGELFKVDIIKTPIIYHIVTNLIEKKEEEPLESLCTLLTAIGKHYESKDESIQLSLNPIMDELTKLVSENRNSENAPQVSSRIRFMIHDVLDLRANNWVLRRYDNTIDQMLDNDQWEQFETYATKVTRNVKKSARPRQDNPNKQSCFVSQRIRSHQKRPSIPSSRV